MTYADQDSILTALVYAWATTRNGPFGIREAMAEFADDEEGWKTGDALHVAITSALQRLPPGEFIFDASGPTWRRMLS